MKEIVLKIAEDCDRLGIFCLSVCALFLVLSVGMCARADMQHEADAYELMLEKDYTAAQIICATTSSLQLKDKCVDQGMKVE